MIGEVGGRDARLVDEGEAEALHGAAGLGVLGRVLRNDRLPLRGRARHTDTDTGTDTDYSYTDIQ